MASGQEGFCHRCGKKMQSSFVYCPHCGTQTMNDSNETRTKLATTTKEQLYQKITGMKFNLPSFNSFKAKREAERTANFGRKKNKKVDEKEVCIYVGVMDESGSIKRGGNLPVKIITSSTAEQLKHAAISKHAAFNKRFNGIIDYDLVYRDGTEVMYIPGTDPPEPFSLARYKEVSGFGYARIFFFLLPKSHEKEAISSDSSDDDNEDDEDGDALQPVPWLQNKEQEFKQVPSTNTSSCNSDANTASSSTSHNLSGVQCPTCLEFFSVNTIIKKADRYANWLFDFDPEPSTSEESCIIVDYETCSEVDCAEQLSSSTTVTKTIEHLQSNLSKDPAITINIRRKTMWEDFGKERERKFTPDKKVKVVFLGEPAIDDGGPRRELFSGMSL